VFVPGQSYGMQEKQSFHPFQSDAWHKQNVVTKKLTRSSATASQPVIPGDKFNKKLCIGKKRP